MDGAYSMNKLIKILSLYCEDIMILAGLILIVITTYKVNVIVANYLLGAIFIILGLIKGYICAPPSFCILSKAFLAPEDSFAN